MSRYEHILFVPRHKMHVTRQKILNTVKGLFRLKMAENMVEEDVHTKEKGRRKMMGGDKTVT